MFSTQSQLGGETLFKTFVFIVHQANKSELCTSATTMLAAYFSAGVKKERKKVPKLKQVPFAHTHSVPKTEINPPPHTHVR